MVCNGRLQRLALAVENKQRAEILDKVFPACEAVQVDSAC
jgi:hypothetical protein